MSSRRFWLRSLLPGLALLTALPGLASAAATAHLIGSATTGSGQGLGTNWLRYTLGGDIVTLDILYTVDTRTSFRTPVGSPVAFLGGETSEPRTFTLLAVGLAGVGRRHGVAWGSGRPSLSAQARLEG